MEEKITYYVRASTDTQEQAHQLDDLDRWFDDNGYKFNTADAYVDLDVSGSTREREEFLRLLEEIQAGNIDHVVTWEISRIGRRGAVLQEFFDACEDNDTVVHITDGKVDRINPDGTNRFIADIVGMVYTEERHQLIRRTKSGIRYAKKEGKWLGQVPAGFERVDGYLRPNTRPDEDEIGYLEMCEAIERVDNGESYRSVAHDFTQVTRQTLSNIYQGERRDWYLNGDANDPRVEEALEEVVVDESRGGE